MNASGTVTRCQLGVPEVSVALSVATMLQFLCVCNSFLSLLCVRENARGVTFESVCAYVWMFAGGRVVGRAMTPRPAQTVE